MSEQEKMNAVPAEGTITEAKVADERSWLKRFADNHPKAWKWAKRIGAAVGVTGGLVCAFEAGKACGGRLPGTTVTITDGCDTEENNEEMPDDVFEE